MKTSLKLLFCFFLISSFQLSFASDRTVSSDDGWDLCDSSVSEPCYSFESTREYKEGELALEDFISKGQVEEALSVFQDKGFDFSEVSPNGLPYFSYTFCSECKGRHMLEVFAEEEVDFNRACSSWVNILHYVISYSRTESWGDPECLKAKLKILFDNGLEKTTKNKKGETYLQHAVRKKALPVIEFLLEYNFHLTEHDGSLERMQESTFPWAKELSMKFAEEREMRRERRADKKLRNRVLKERTLRQEMRDLSKRVDYLESRLEKVLGIDPK